MVALLKKEIAGYFSSLTGYVVVTVFLLASSIFMWVIPGQNNVLDAGYSTIDTFFTLSPWVFMFLIPAITMRLFTDEIKTGTIELLMTRPLSNLSVVMAKYLAALSIALISILPTFVYFISVYNLGNPIGNIDMGGTWGSYMGLFFLAAIYVSIGVFASALTNNQIVAFILAVVIIFFMYYGLNSAGLLFANTKAEYIFQNLSISNHYQSISRGVVDTRDLIYFISVSVVFILITEFKIQIKHSNIIRLIIFFAAMLLLNVASSYFFARIDLTSDKRFTLSGSTKKMLGQIDAPVTYKVYLDGDLPAGFIRLKNATNEILNEFKAYGADKIQVEFIDPDDAIDDKARNELYKQLYDKGLNPTNLKVSEKGGGQKQKIIFPCILVCYKGYEYPVNILKSYVGKSAETNLNTSIQSLEYELNFAMHQLTTTKPPRIAFIEGHGELDKTRVADLTKTLTESFYVERIQLNGFAYSLCDTANRNIYDLLIIAKPQTAMPETDKFLIDQFIMNGGSTLWLIDNVNVSMDSLSTAPSTFGLSYNLNIDDQLFKYGVRINPNLIQDIQCSVIPINTAIVGQPSKFAPVPWIFFPLLEPNQTNTITRNIDMVSTQFASSIDTVGEDPAVKKTILLTSSKYSRAVNVPVMVNLSITDEPLNPRNFNQPYLTTGILLEGSFSSVFTNRPSPITNIKTNFPILAKSKPAKIIVLSDGDIVRNETRGKENEMEILPLGYDRITRQTFGNKAFILNSINYLCNFNNLLEARNKDFKLRLLDKPKINREKLKWQLINVLLPILLIVLSGLVFTYFRIKKYSK